MTDFTGQLRRYFLQQRELFPDEYYVEPTKDAMSASNPKLEALDDLAAQVEECQRCELWKTRHQTVFGEGNASAALMFIGEAPGQQEDQMGRPFVGQAGKLLDRILDAIDLSRADIFIANILKCRPPQNRTPLQKEIEQCIGYLNKQIELIDPQLLVCLGLTAARTLLQVKSSLKEMRGKTYHYLDRDVLVTYHPAALLRNASFKRPAWEDFKRIKKLYELKTGEESG